MPTFEITAPNGKVYEVVGPKGSTKEQALAQVKKKLGVGQDVSYTRMAESALGGAADMITGDNTDELLAGAATVGGLAGDYEGTKQSIRQRMDQSAEMAPGSNIAGSVGSLVIPGVGLRSAAAKLGTTASKAVTGGGMVAQGGRGAAAGAGYEALLAAGQDRSLSPDDLIKGATLGAAGGAVGNLVSRVGTRVKNGFKGQDQVRHENLIKRAKSNYDELRNSDATLNPNIFNQAGAKAGQIFEESALGINARGKNTKVVGQNFDQAGASLQNRGLSANMGDFIDNRSDIINKRLYKEGRRRDMTETDRRGVQEVKQTLDESLEASVINPGRFGSGKDLADKLFETNRIETATKKYQTIMAEFTKATNKRDLQRLVNNKSLMDGLTSEAQGVLRKYANEGAFQKILSWLGYMSPLRAVNSAFSLAYNPAVGGPVLGAQLGAGALNKIQSSKMTRELADAMFDQFEKRQRSSGGILGGVGTVGLLGGGGE